MKPHLVLLQNDKYQFMNDSEVKKHLKDIEIILVPLIDICAYIPVRPHKYLKFTSGFITYELEEFYSDLEFNYKSRTVHKTHTVDIHSISELYNIMTSIDRIDFINSIESENDNLYGFGFDVGYMEIGLYDENKELIYYKEYRVSNKKTDLMEMKYPKLYDEFEEIFHAWIEKVLPFRDTDGYIKMDMVNKKFAYNKANSIYSVFEIDISIYMHELIGIYNGFTNSIMFMDYEKYHIIKKLDYISLRLNIKNQESMTSLDDIIYPFWVFYGTDMLALISYIHYLVNGLLFLMTNDFFFNLSISNDGQKLEYIENDAIQIIHLEIGLQKKNEPKEDLIIYDHNPYPEEIYAEIIDRTGGNIS